MIPSSVASTAMAYRFDIPYASKESASLSIAAKLFEHLVLHPKIREVGGAYGGKAIFSPLMGNFCFFSYRDPNLKTTLDAFEEAPKKIMAKKFSTSDLFEAKLALIQDLDSPLSPLKKASYSYSYQKSGINLEQRENFRKNILSASKEEIADAVEKHFFSSQAQKPKIVSFASRKFLESEIAKMDKRKHFEILEIDSLIK